MRLPPTYRDLPKYPVTGGTILLATGVTIAYLTKAIEITPLLENGEIRRGEVWRLLTSTLPHADPLHLLFNLYWTWVFGTLVESVFGHFRTLAIFVLLALIANGAEFALLIGGIGLSGIGYGLFGMLWVLSSRDCRFAGAVDAKTVQLFVAWFFLCIVLTAMGYPIGNIAHGAGCAAGALLGWTIATSPRLKIAGVTAMLSLAIAVLAGDTLLRPWINLSKYIGGDDARFAGSDEARFGYDALTAQKNQEAFRWYQDATRMNPRDAGYFYNLGIACQRLDKKDQARAAFEQACGLAPGNTEYRDALDGV